MPASDCCTLGTGRGQTPTTVVNNIKPKTSLKQKGSRKVRMNRSYMPNHISQRTHTGLPERAKHVRAVSAVDLPPGAPHLSYVLDRPIQASAAPAADRPQRVRFVKSNVMELKRVNRQKREKPRSGKDDEHVNNGGGC